MEQQQIQQMDRKAALLEAFDSMSDECQETALMTLHVLARKFPRRVPVVLSLVSNRAPGCSLGE